jgi:hypothetical protein
VGGEGFAVDASLIQAMPTNSARSRIRIWRRDRDPARSKQLFYLTSIQATLKRKCFLAGKIRTAQHTKIKFNGFGEQRTYLGFRHSGRRRAMHISLTKNVDLPELRIPDSKLRTK